MTDQPKQDTRRRVTTLEFFNPKLNKCRMKENIKTNKGYDSKLFGKYGRDSSLETK